MNSTTRHELLLILDFGGQYTQLIARRVRELHVFCEIMPFDTPLEKLTARNPKAIILSGGPERFSRPPPPPSPPPFTPPPPLSATQPFSKSGYLSLVSVMEPS